MVNYVYSRRGFAKSKSAAKKFKRVGRKRTGARKSIVKIVKSVLSRQAENKSWFDYGLNQSIVTSSGGSTPTYKNLLPQLSQGSSASNRVGNEVRVKSGYIRGHVNILPFENTTNPLPSPLYVKMWILSAKAINTNNLSLTTIGSNFIDLVSSASVLQGNMLDIDFQINKDAWTIHASKTVKIGAGSYVSTGPVSQATYFDNSPMSVPFSFSYGKYIKTLKYDDSGPVPTNRNMFIVFQAVSANGASGGGYLPAEFHYTNRVDYEDL
uniref:hypothetical protein n=1 Tax=Limnohabitans sp. TaxID=1907725 RepID=UPI004048529F